MILAVGNERSIFSELFSHLNATPDSDARYLSHEHVHLSICKPHGDNGCAMMLNVVNE